MRFEPYEQNRNIAHSTATQSLFVLLNDGTQKEVKDQINWGAVLGYAIVDKPKESQLAPGHNPDKLTTQQVGEGWRLLDEDEIHNKHPWTKLVDALTSDEWYSGCYAASKKVTYRTRLSREQLRLLDDGWTPWLGEGERPKGRIEFIVKNGVKSIEQYDARLLDWLVNNSPFDIIAYRPAKTKKIVPWDRSTCPPLPFEVVDKANGNRYGVLSATKDFCAVYPNGYIEWETLKTSFTLPNGSPCGQEVSE